MSVRLTKKEMLQSLNGALELLNTHKLAKGAYAKKANGHTECDVSSNEMSCLCTTAALCTASNVECVYTDVDVPNDNLDCAILRTVNYLYGSTYDSVHEFNDDPRTTKDMVLTVLEKTRELVKMGRV